MSTLSVTDVLRANGFAPLAEFSGMPKNARKNRNRKIKHAALHGGSGGISALLGSAEYSAYIEPTRYGKAKKVGQVSARISSLSTMSSSAPTGPCGGWGRLPNVALIDYAADDPRGWTHVDSFRRRAKKCQIDENDPPYDSGSA